MQNSQALGLSCAYLASVSPTASPLSLTEKHTNALWVGEMTEVNSSGNKIAEAELLPAESNVC